MDACTNRYGSLCSLYYDATEGYASEKEVAFFASFIEKNGGRALEAMSGSGRLQIPLIKRGLLVDGVDYSPSMRARFKERCHIEGVQGTVYEQSLTALALPHRYATVFIALGSFQLIVDREQALKALRALRAHMVPGADILIDVFIPDVTVATHVATSVRIDEHRHMHVTTRYIFDQKRQVAEGICHYELHIDGAVAQREDELIEVVWYTDDELKKLLKEADFEVVAFYEESFRSAGPSRIVHARVKN